ncbi:hypothetical protein F5Y12DRAFT_765020 [Xylaria sp. FL1777]|nr:hypothetical protein F5Y12DRAFT_765020 [Xylaria sp. FL1777]
MQYPSVRYLLYAVLGRGVYTLPCQFHCRIRYCSVIYTTIPSCSNRETQFVVGQSQGRDQTRWCTYCVKYCVCTRDPGMRCLFSRDASPDLART